MNRQIIAGLLIAFAVGGCVGDSEPAPTAESKEVNGGNERAKAPGDFCGGYAGIQCDGDLYCDFPVETSCGSGDQGGVCTVPPGACTKIYDPVCGCNEKTYGNACEASRASMSVAHKGECK